MPGMPPLDESHGALKLTVAVLLMLTPAQE
jgi:hypothetical protein